MLKDHFLITEYGAERLKNAQIILSEIKLCSSLPGKNYIDIEKNIEILTELLDLLEYVIIDEWDVETKRHAYNKTFNEAAVLYVEIVQSIPLKGEGLIPYVFKMISFGYLAERWETVRRYLIEHEDTLMAFEESEQWNLRLYQKIYKAIFYIVRKKHWKDLENSVKLIAELRNEQEIFEKEFLDATPDIALKRSDALELTALYHFAKSVDLVGNFQQHGQPNNVQTEINFHFNYAVQAAEFSGHMDLNLTLRFLQPALVKMIDNSIWRIGHSINSRVTKFLEVITKADKPAIELLYPQRYALLEKGLLDVAQKAVVVNMPTSSGKTLLAEFRILLALNQFSDDKGWVAYVAPTKALVNQITTRLRKDLSPLPLGLRIESLSGALEFDAYENELLQSKDNKFDILVTTPEKLSLLLRQGVIEKINRPLALTVIDEAHNIADKTRGINLEILLSIIKHDYNDSINLLLLTPFIPNGEDIAKWLSPQASRSISIELNWQPNDKIIGMFYPVENYTGIGFKTLQTSNHSIQSKDDLTFGTQVFIKKQLDAKYRLTAESAKQFNSKENVLVIAGDKAETFLIAEIIYQSLIDMPEDPDIALIKKFIQVELGEDFPLVKFLDRRIGIHHSGLPDDIRVLMEQLMEDDKLKFLVATTTIAQGINFNISTLLMSSYSYPYTPHMPLSDFWNLVGRVGRMQQSSVGMVGIASTGSIETLAGQKIAKYVIGQTEELISVLVKMVRDAISTSADLDLAKFFNRPEWSTFLQYIAHTYKQTNDLTKYLAEIELKLMDTFGYNKLEAHEQTILKTAVKKYTNDWLKANAEVANLSDLTGFSPNSVLLALHEAREQKIPVTDFTATNLFASTDNGTLKKLVGIMLKAPEIKTNLSEFINNSSTELTQLPAMISDWVSGLSIQQLADKYYKGEDRIKQITQCVSAIYSKLSQNAAWGMAAVQQLNGINYDKLTDEEKNSLANLPAMILYGVSTNEGIAMRKANVPRSMSDSIGKLLRQQKAEIYKISNTEVLTWLNSLADSVWEESNPNKKIITGAEYKRVWKKLSGVA